MTRASILFVHNHRASFVAQDVDCLRSRHRVTELPLTGRFPNPLAVWRQVRAHRLVFGWFASWHTFLPLLFARVLQKPSVLVIGGYDLANLPAIGYGHQRPGLRNQFKKWISRATMRLATRLIANSKFSVIEANTNAGFDDKNLQGIYHGVPDRFGPLTTQPRDRLAITIGNLDRCNLHRKGLEPFVAAAALLPDVRFVVIGSWKDDAIAHLRSLAAPNVEFTGRIDDHQLDDYCRRASAYVQASRHEGFGIAVAEAMLAGCIPVVTRAGALPEVAGDCGVYLDTTDPAEIARAIAYALAAPHDVRVQARERILIQFPIQQREAALADVVAQLLEGTPRFVAKCVPAGNRT